MLEGGEALQADVVVNAAGIDAPSLSPGASHRAAQGPSRHHRPLSAARCGGSWWSWATSRARTRSAPTRSPSTCSRARPGSCSSARRASSSDMRGDQRRDAAADAARAALTTCPMLARPVGAARLDRVPAGNTGQAAVHRRLGRRCLRRRRATRGSASPLRSGTGGLIADLVAGRAPAIDPAPFAPRRALDGH